MTYGRSELRAWWLALNCKLTREREEKKWFARQESLAGFIVARMQLNYLRLYASLDSAVNRAGATRLELQNYSIRENVGRAFNSASPSCNLIVDPTYTYIRQPRDTPGIMSGVNRSVTLVCSLISISRILFSTIFNTYFRTM